MEEVTAPVDPGPVSALDEDFRELPLFGFVTTIAAQPGAPLSTETVLC